MPNKQHAVNSQLFQLFRAISAHKCHIHALRPSMKWIITCWRSATSCPGSWRRTGSWGPAQLPSPPVSARSPPSRPSESWDRSSYRSRTSLPVARVRTGARPTPRGSHRAWSLPISIGTRHWCQRSPGILKSVERYRAKVPHLANACFQGELCKVARPCYLPDGCYYWRTRKVPIAAGSSLCTYGNRRAGTP